MFDKSKAKEKERGFKNNLPTEVGSESRQLRNEMGEHVVGAESSHSQVTVKSSQVKWTEGGCLPLDAPEVRLIHLVLLSSF